VSDTIWASIKTDWHTDAVCSGAADFLFFPSDETDSKLDRIRSLYCNLCPVRAKCLNSALINGDSGFWGGTSYAMRQAMLRTRHRAKCPVCQSKSLIEIEPAEEDHFYQVCLACAASWRSDVHSVEAQMS
jgi:hypothetical protein